MNFPRRIVLARSVDTRGWWQVMCFGFIDAQRVYKASDFVSERFSRHCSRLCHCSNCSEHGDCQCNAPCLLGIHSLRLWLLHPVRAPLPATQVLQGSRYVWTSQQGSAGVQ